MSFKKQLIKLKEKWLIIVLVVIAFLMFAMLSSGVSLNSINYRNFYAMNDSLMSNEKYYSQVYGSS